MQEEIKQLNQRITYLEGIIFELNKSDRYVFEKHVQMLDGAGIQCGRTKGTRIGTQGGSTGQKIAFYGEIPVVQWASITEPSGGGSSSTDAIDIYARASINEIRACLRNIGIVTPLTGPNNPVP